jgi:hypothetical protein
MHPVHKRHTTSHFASFPELKKLKNSISLNLKSGNGAEPGHMIDIARWQTTHHPVHPLFQAALAFTPVLELYFKHVALVEGHRFERGQLPPPVGGRRVLENVIINVSHKLTIADFVQLAHTHAIYLELEKLELMAILAQGSLSVN